MAEQQVDAVEIMNYLTFCAPGTQFTGFTGFTSTKVQILALAEQHVDAVEILNLLYVSIRQHTSAYVSIRQYTSAYGDTELT
jgi:hypothetical protein